MPFISKGTLAGQGHLSDQGEICQCGSFVKPASGIATSGRNRGEIDD